MLPFVITTSDRALSFSRFALADRVWVIRFNMALPSLPPQQGSDVVFRNILDRPSGRSHRILQFLPVLLQNQTTE
jgi:hypothetical protein